jgi:hypothetical protein
MVPAAEPQEPRDDPLPGDRAREERQRRRRVILEMGEPAIEPALVGAGVGVGHKGDGLIAPRGQVLRQRRVRGIEGEVPLRIDFPRPLAGEEASVRGVRPWGGGQGVAVLDAAPGPSRQVGGGIPGIPVAAQAIGADGVPDDEHDVPGPRRRRQSGHRPRFAQRLPARGDGRQKPQHTDQRQRDQPRPPCPRATGCDRIADQPREPGGQHQATDAVQRHPQQGRPDRQCRQEPRPHAQRDEPGGEPAQGSDDRPGERHQGRVPERDGPREIPGSSKIPLGIQAELLEEDERHVEVARTKPQRDRQQKRRLRRERDPARRAPARNLGRGSVHLCEVLRNVLDHDRRRRNPIYRLID